MTFGQTSATRLKTCDKRLQSIMYRAIQVSKIDFGIAEGYRTTERQQELFKQGLTQLNGVTELSNHNYNPSIAVDIFGWVDGKTDYSIPVMCYLAGVIQSVAVELGYSVRWGGNWDQDGVILADQNFDDLPHYELT